MNVQKFFDNVETAELMSRLDADVSNIVSTLKHTISSGLRNTITMVSGCINLVSFSFLTILFRWAEPFLYL